MTKYWTALMLVVVMGTTIAIIDARSNDVTSSERLPVDMSSSTDRIYATGMVEGATEDVNLWPEHAGRVSEVFVKPGDWVEEGAVLLRQDSARQQQEVVLASARLDLAEAALERLRNGARAEEREEAHALYRAAQAKFNQADRTWNRIEHLNNEHAISQQEADDQLAKVSTLRAEVEAAEARMKQLEAPARADEVRAAAARVAAAQAELDLARIDFAKSALVSPHRGRVLDVNAEAGEMSGPDASQPLVVLSDTSVVRVRAYVEELDAPRVAVGMPASITADGLPDKTFSGQVISISPRMSTKTIHADGPSELYDTKVREVLVELSDANQMIVGLRVDISFEISQNAGSSSDS